MRERILTVLGVDMHIRDTGRGDPILLLHGGGPGTSSDGWRRVQELLGDRWNVVAPDFPGFGRSGPMSPRGGGPSGYAELTLAAMNGLGHARVAVVGHSMGAQIAARAALAQPDRFTHLVLVAPGGRFFGVPGLQPGITAIGEFLVDPTAERMRNVVELMNARLGDVEDSIRQRMSAVTSGSRLEQLRELMGKRSSETEEGQENILARLKRLPVPAMLVWGAEERFTPFEHGRLVHAALPDGAHFVEIAGAGHTVQHDTPEELAATIAKFLDE